MMSCMCSALKYLPVYEVGCLIQAVRGHMKCFPLVVSYCWRFWHYLTPCSFKNKKAQIKSIGFTVSRKAPPSSPLHRNCLTGAGEKEEPALIQDKAFFFKTNLSHTWQSILSLGAWLEKHYLNPLAAWRVIYKHSCFLYIFKATLQIYAELAKQMLQNLHVPTLLQNCHLFGNNWNH